MTGVRRVGAPPRYGVSPWFLSARLFKASQVRADTTAFVVLGLLLLPRSLKAVALSIGIDPHPISFFIGPALYRFDPSTIPNVDFMTQYGVGPGVLLSFFLNESPFKAFEVAAGLTIASTAIFVWTFYLLARWLMQSSAWALLLTMTATIMNCYGPMPFRAPSGWPTRYPLLAVFCIVFAACWASRSNKSRIIWLYLAGLIAGTSLYWVTETGIYLTVFGALCYLITARGHMVRTLVECAGFLAAAIVAFFLLSLAANGASAFSLGYYVELLRPLFMYESGFGDWPVNWLDPAEFVFIVIVPVVLTATTIWAISAASNANGPFETRQNVLLLISLLALAQLLKFWNMSLAAVWLSNAYLPLLVMVFWLRTGMKFYDGQVTHPKARRIFSIVMPAAVLAIAVSYLLAFDDPRMETAYGVGAYRLYPSVLGRVLGWKSAPPSGIEFSRGDVAAEDVALIDTLVATGGRAYLLSSRDWAYLLRAKRAPGFPFIPSTMTPLRDQLYKPLREAKIIFIDNGQGLWGATNAEIMQIVEGELTGHFRQVQTGKDLVAYVRVGS